MNVITPAASVVRVSRSAPMATAYVVQWCDAATMMKLAGERGWTEEASTSILDLVDEDEADKLRVFSSLTRAKDWARRNKALDFWCQPEVAVYEWPDRRRLSWERETVKRLRYVGAGCGWEYIT